MALNYIATHSEHLDQFDFSDLKRFATPEQFSAVVELFGAALELKGVGEILLRNHNSEQQLREIVAELRYKSPRFFGKYTINRFFYNYFQNEALDLMEIEKIIGEKLCPLHFKNRPWLIKDFDSRAALNTIISVYNDFLLEAIIQL